MEMKLFGLIATLLAGAGALRPLVVWHGVDDSCSGVAGSVIAQMKETVPGLYVHCIQIGDTPEAERHDSLFMDAQKQLDIACANVKADKNLENGFNAFGISQGGLLLRALVQRCPPSKINNFITVSSPHQGIFGLPTCFNTVPESECRSLTESLTREAYTARVQSMFTPAQYWHDPMQEEEYREKSTFAAVYNNERNFNATFKENLLQVNKFVLYRNTEDEVIIPRESPHFAFYQEGQRVQVVNFTETRLYKEDLIGLKELFEDGRLQFREIPGNHVNMPDDLLASLTSEYFSD